MPSFEYASYDTNANQQSLQPSSVALGANFTFNGALKATIAGASNIIKPQGLPLIFQAVSDAGLTNGIVLIEGFIDVAQTQAVALGVITLSSAGYGAFKCNANYFGYRATVVAITGGAIAVYALDGNSAVVLQNASSNPATTLVPVLAPYILSQSAVPVINPSNTNFANNGAFTIATTALPTTYTNAWIILQANAIFAG